jgi:hypothetical protein
MQRPEDLLRAIANATPEFTGLGLPELGALIRKMVMRFQDKREMPRYGEFIGE